MAILTDLKAKRISPDDNPLPHGGVTGLSLWPAKTKGRGKWILRYVSPVTGKRRKAGLGPYPDVSIAEVAVKASEFRVRLANGEDPLEDKQQVAKRVDKVVPSFEEAAFKLYENLLPSWKNKKHGQQWINTLKQYAFPVIGNKLVDVIEVEDIELVLKPIWLSKHETASRLKQRIHAVMAWAIAYKFAKYNPVDSVQYLLPNMGSRKAMIKHQPSMPWRDIPEFLVKLKNENIIISHLMLEFLILTACRSGEVRGMKWQEVNFKDKVWTIPANRMKAGIEHRVPLSTRTVEILNRLKGLDEVLVFPSVKKKTIMSDMALTQLLRRMEAQSDTTGRLATAHGFRSSFRNWCSENGYARDLAERALAHTIQNQVEAAYHRTDLLEQRKPMMEAWAEICLGKL
ncbi:tyrosine-type recombinase/integrase [Entomomonas sp. E2T0]|uniref:tyrosine-type recombinase/integrase n=1 Tax=Entomomonas sp. E2T0 TaxID=2930213 RepID=UPI00222851CF|nr:site-specific integrase [Entomomonas sp. E2T0]UYZ85373.1 tyrosine-type recombinase/integrase [Entomomonas sp. E2T0]